MIQSTSDDWTASQLQLLGQINNPIDLDNWSPSMTWTTGQFLMIWISSQHLITWTTDQPLARQRSELGFFFSFHFFPFLLLLLVFLFSIPLFLYFPLGKYNCSLTNQNHKSTTILCFNNISRTEVGKARWFPKIHTQVNGKFNLGFQLPVHSSSLVLNYLRKSQSQN